MTELKPCPFCGGDAIVTSYESCDCCGKAYNGSVSCKCGIKTTHHDTDEEAIEAWNTRSIKDDNPADVQELLLMIDKLWDEEAGLRKENDICLELGWDSPVLNIHRKIRKVLNKSQAVVTDEEIIKHVSYHIDFMISRDNYYQPKEIAESAIKAYRAINQLKQSKNS